MGCGCAGVERAALTIAAAGAGAKILGPQGNHAVYCDDGAALTLQGLAVEGRGDKYDSAVLCASKGRAELSGCTLTSPKGTGLEVRGGATATMDGGSISGCGNVGVSCGGSGTATVRPPALCCAPLSAAGGGRGGVFQSCFAVFCRRFLAHRNRRDDKDRRAKNRGQKMMGT